MPREPPGQWPAPRGAPGRSGGTTREPGEHRHVVTSPALGAALGPWSPLRQPTYRALWLAVLVSNIGTWMQMVGAQWVLVTDARAAVLVPLVQTATALPVALLALPGGVLADSIDKRRLLIG